MRKICFLVGDFSRVGGTERVTSIIANHLAISENYSVHILSITKKNKKVFFDINEKIVVSNIYNKAKINYKINYINIVLR